MTQLRIILVTIALVVLSVTRPVPAWSASGQAGGLDRGVPHAFAQDGSAAVAASIPPTGYIPTGQAEARAWQVLSQSVASPKATRRINAITALGTISDNERAIRMVAACLKDHDAQVRALAAKKLGEMHAVSAIPELKDTLEDHSGEVSFAAAMALAELGDYTGRRVLWDILTGKRKASPGLMESEKRAISQKMHDPGGIAIFAASSGAGAVMPGSGFAIRALGGLGKDHTSGAKSSAADALASDPDPETVRQLEIALGDSHLLVSTAAAKALGDQNSPGVIAALESHLNDAHSAVRDMAAASIVRLSQPEGGDGMLHAVR